MASPMTYPKQAHPGSMKAQKSPQYVKWPCTLQPGLVQLLVPHGIRQSRGSLFPSGHIVTKYRPTAGACAWDPSRWMLALTGFVLGPLCVKPSVVPSHGCILTQSQGPVRVTWGSVEAI